MLDCHIEDIIMCRVEAERLVFFLAFVITQPLDFFPSEYPTVTSLFRLNNLALPQGTGSPGSSMCLD